MTIQELLNELGLNEEDIRRTVMLEQSILQRYPDQAKQTMECALKEYHVHVDAPEIIPGENQVIQMVNNGFLHGLFCAYDTMATDLEIVLKRNKGKTITIGE